MLSETIGAFVLGLIDANTDRVRLIYPLKWDDRFEPWDGNRLSVTLTGN